MTKLQQLHNALHLSIVAYFNPLQQREPLIPELDEVQAIAFQKELRDRSKTFSQKTANLCRIIDALGPNERETSILHYLTYVLVTIHEMLETSEPLMLKEGTYPFNLQIFLHQHLENIQTIFKTSDADTHTILFSHPSSLFQRSFPCNGLSFPLNIDEELSSDSEIPTLFCLSIILQKTLPDYLEMDERMLQTSTESMLEERLAQRTLQREQAPLSPLEKRLLAELQEKNAKITELQETIRLLTENLAIMALTSAPAHVQNDSISTVATNVSPTEPEAFKIGDHPNNFWSEGTPKTGRATQTPIPVPDSVSEPHA
ncbi:MAG: hypothetical protein Q8R79_04950 [Legionellaceae bacterium]|nr:hypothetical protein [Legionellaceae bacterium]